MLLVQFPHHRPRRRQRVPHKQEQALVAREGDALSNDVGKLAERQVARNEKLVLVDEWYRFVMDRVVDNESRTLLALLSESFRLDG
jgi:hypothetical protein